jgi:peptidyl-prolyl cis-trans isomerase SurA
MRQAVVKQTIAALCLGVLLGGMSAPAACAQDLFAPRLYVNEQVITEYEVIQRALFLQVLRAPGDPMEEALKALTEDRLRQSEARRLGLTLTEEAIIAGMTEFAGRANLTAEQLIGELEKVGISVETFRDFVVAGLLFREAVRARFAGQISVTEADIDKAIQAAARPRALKVLASELVIPMPPGREESAMALANRLSDQIDSEAAFAQAARSYSAAPTAGRGGRLEWLPLANLPPAIAGQVLALGLGEVSKPIQVPGAVVLFLLREVANDETAEPIAVNVEYARFLIEDDPALIAKIKSSARTCLELYGYANGLPEDRLVIETQSMAEVPQDIGMELARLDPGETSSALTRSGLRMLVMLCGRSAVAETPPTRDEVRLQVQNAKLDGLATGYLAELKAAAIIREP